MEKSKKRKNTQKKQVKIKYPKKTSENKKQQKIGIKNPILKK